MSTSRTKRRLKFRNDPLILENEQLLWDIMGFLWKTRLTYPELRARR